MALHVGDHFDSWAEFMEKAERHFNDTHQPMVKSSSKKCETANRGKTADTRFPEDMVYSAYTYGCSHQGKFKSKGDGIKQYKSFKNSCPAKVHAGLDRSSRKIVVRTIIEDHSHPIGPEVHSHYPKTRLLDKKEEQALHNLARMKVSTKVLRDHARTEYGKNLRLYDVRNIKTRMRLKDKKSHIQENPLNDAQMVLLLVREQEENDPGCSINVGVDDQGVLKYIFYQSSAMKSTFAKYPENLEVDCTYCVNNRLMPLLSFVCNDGNNESRVIGFCLISDESKEMLSMMFEMLKNENSCSDSIKTIMVDKDMNEIECLKSVFPEVDIELCLFHVPKALRQKINNLECSKAVKELLREYCAKCCYARNEEEYEENKTKLLDLNGDFKKYFLENWDSIKSTWTQYSRSQKMNLANRTNNRIESYHQKIKSEVQRNAPLDVMLKNVLLVIDTLESEIAKRLFYGAMRHPAARPFPEIREKVTPFAYEQVLKALSKSEKLECLSIDGESVKFKDHDIVIHAEPNACICSTYICKRLPCMHILRARKELGLEIVVMDLFDQRYHLDFFASAPLPAISGAPPSVSLSGLSESNLSKGKRYSLAKCLTDRIAQMMSDLSPGVFRQYFSRLEDFEKALSMLNDIDIETDGEGVAPVVDVIIGHEETERSEESRGESVRVETEVGVILQVESREVEVGGSSPEVVQLESREVEERLPVESREVEIEVGGSSPVESREVEIEVGGSSPADSRVVETEVRGRLTAEMQVGSSRKRAAAECNREQERKNSVLTDLFISNVKPPLAVPQKGRPKGSGLTVLGMVRKGRGRKRRKLNLNKAKVNEENVSEELVVCQRCMREDPDKTISCGDTLWVSCDRCSAWYHQICVVFDTDSDVFYCEACSLN